MELVTKVGGSGPIKKEKEISNKIYREREFFQKFGGLNKIREDDYTRVNQRPGGDVSTL